MIECPKCGSSKISGPRYVRTSSSGCSKNGEHLVYFCLNCGYSHREPTRDSKQNSPFDIIDNFRKMKKLLHPTYTNRE